MTGLCPVLSLTGQCPASAVITAWFHAKTDHRQVRERGEGQGQGAEDGGRRREDGGRKTEDGGETTEERGRRTEDEGSGEGGKAQCLVSRDAKTDLRQVLSLRDER